MLLSHHLSSSHWTTHLHSEPELFSLFLWILESHLIKATETSQCNQWNWMCVSVSSIKRTILVWQLLWIKLDQLKCMTQTPLLCFMSGDSYKTKWDSGTIKINACHNFMLKSGQRTHHRHWPFHTLKWELLATALPRWVSKDLAFPDHPSVNNSY